MSHSTVAAGLVSGLLDYAGSIGACTDELRRKSGIERSALKNPDARLPLSAYLSLFRFASEDLKKPDFALRLGASTLMAELSIVGLLMEASETIGGAYEQMRRYGRLATQIDHDPQAARFIPKLDQGRFWLVDQLNPGDVFRPLIESSFAWLVCGPKRYMDRSPVISVAFTWPEPNYACDYQAVFKCPVHFNSDQNALEMHPDSFSWPVRQNPHYVFAMLTERADTLLQDLNRDCTHTDRLRSLMATKLHRGQLSADVCARELGMSRQTLYRQLRSEGTSYRVILDQLRQDLSMAYLEGRKTSVNEIAYLTGFSDTPAFTKAFRRWTGLSPSAYRNSQRSSRGGFPIKR